MEPRKPHRQKEDYKLRTHMIHGNFDSKKWDYNHHVVPPVSHTTAFRLSSLERGARGFGQFASADEALSGHVPIYIYDRLDEPTRSMLEENLAYAEGGEICGDFRLRHGEHQWGIGRRVAPRAGSHFASNCLRVHVQLDDELASPLRGVGAFRRFPHSGVDRDPDYARHAGALS